MISTKATFLPWPYSLSAMREPAGVCACIWLSLRIVLFFSLLYISKCTNRRGSVMTLACYIFLLFFFRATTGLKPIDRSISVLLL